MIEAIRRGVINTAMLAAACVVPLNQARAEIVSTGQAAGGANTESARVRILRTVERADVEQALVARGVDLREAKNRVAALSEEEVSALAARLDSLPAGGRLTHTELVLLIVLIVVLALVL